MVIGQPLDTRRQTTIQGGLRSLWDTNEEPPDQPVSRRHSQGHDRLMFSVDILDPHSEGGAGSCIPIFGAMCTSLGGEMLGSCGVYRCFGRSWAGDACMDSFSAWVVKESRGKDGK